MAARGRTSSPAPRSALLRDLLFERLATVGKMHGEDFLPITYGLASVVNAVGALFAVVFLAAKKG